MSKLTIELTDDLAARLDAVSTAQKVPPAKWAKEAVVRALSSQNFEDEKAHGWPTGYFQKFAGCLADDNWQPPSDPTKTPSHLSESYASLRVSC